MTPTRTCTRCLDRPAADGLGWCRGCRHRIDRDLGDMPALAVDLEATMARDAAARLGGRRSAETPLPYAERAANALHAMRAFLVGWCRLLCDEHGAPLPADTIVAMALHLQRWLGWLDRHEASGELADELAQVTAVALMAVDRPRDRTRVTVGPCPEVDGDGVPCPGQAVAYFPDDPQQRPVIRCGACGVEWHAESWSRLGERVLARQCRRPSWDPAAMQRLAAMMA